MLVKEAMKSWTDEGVLYTLFRMRTKDSVYYLATAKESYKGFEGLYDYTYDHIPNNKTVQDDHIDHIAEIAIDRHEAELGFL
jgi:hypothetical protein